MPRVWEQDTHVRKAGEMHLKGWDLVHKGAGKGQTKHDPENILEGFLGD